jgi:hypothetical protein
MKKKEILKFLLWVLLLLPFFRPDYLTRYGMINNITNIWKIISTVIAIILFLKRGKLSKKIFLLILFTGWILIVTILNNGNVQLFLLIATSIISMALILENRNK